MSVWTPSIDCGTRLLRVNFSKTDPSKLGDEEFAGICSFGNIQVCNCYSYLDEPLNVFDVVARCEKCKYRISPTSNKEIKEFNERNHINGGQYKLPYYIESDYANYLNKQNPKAFVYFVTDGHKIKIGSTMHPDKRSVNLQTGNGTKIFYISLIPCKDSDSALELEKILHKIYMEYNTSGEWFNIKHYIDIRKFNSEFCPDKYIENTISVADYCELI